MADFTADMVRTASASLAVGAIENPGSGPRRIRIYEFTWGYSGTPADAAAELELQRHTASGTATAVTPTAVDPAEAAATTVVEENHTVDPTLTANAYLARVPMNQRSTYRWIAREGKELVIPATTGNGIAFRTPTTPTVAVAIAASFTE